MDRGENRKKHYLSQKEYILQQATERSKQYLPDKSPKEIREIIDQILNSQYKELNKRTYTHTEVEISGLGRYEFSIPKANKRMKSLNKSLKLQMNKIQEQKIFPPTTPKLEQIKKEMQEIQEKINHKYEFINTKRVYKANAKRRKELQGNNQGSDQSNEVREQVLTTGSD